MRRIFALTAAICFAAIFSAEAATIDSIAVFSKKMKRDIAVSVIVPESEAAQKELPVVYMLNGYSGNEKSWIRTRKDMLDLADRYQMIIVCPNGENSWYWDSPIAKNSQFETFISRELVSHIDKHYPTVATRNGRAITGNSMGGHGALWNAIRNSDVFGAAGSMSGGLDIRPFPTRWDLSNLLGEKDSNEKVWDRYTCINQVDKLKNKRLALIIDCGVDDFFIEVNNDFHNALIEQGVEHDYIVRAGAHTAAYWRNAVYYQLFFFDTFFRRQE